MGKKKIAKNGSIKTQKRKNSSKGPVHSVGRNARTGRFVSAKRSEKNTRVLAATVGGAVIGNIIVPGIGGAVVGGIAGAIVGNSYDGGNDE